MHLAKESQLQLKLRAERLHINSERLHVIADTDLDHILEVALNPKTIITGHRLHTNNVYCRYRGRTW